MGVNFLLLSPDVGRCPLVTAFRQKKRATGSRWGLTVSKERGQQGEMDPHERRLEEVT